MDRLGALCFATAVMIANSTFAQDVDQTVLDCDRYAASNNDVNTTAGRAGVKFKDLNPEKAKPVCEAAYKANPDVARLPFQLGRVGKASELRTGENLARGCDRQRLYPCGSRTRAPV